LGKDVPAKIVVVDGLDPADLSNNYPYAKPTVVIYSPTNAAKVQPFLDFITSAEAKKLLAEQNIATPSK
jgi:hypothetical protein